MGSWSISKSYILNKIFCIRSNVNSNGCIDGLLMSLSILEKENNKKVLYILLDCEGLFSVRRSLEEELRIVLVAVSMSDFVILNV